MIDFLSCHDNADDRKLMLAVVKKEGTNVDRFDYMPSEPNNSHDPNIVTFKHKMHPSSPSSSISDTTTVVASVASKSNPSMSEP